MKIETILLITNNFVINKVDKNYFIYEFCLHLKKNNPKLKIIILTPFDSYLKYDHAILKKAIDNLITFNCKEINKELVISGIKDFFKYKSFWKKGKQVLEQIIESKNIDHVLAFRSLSSGYIAKKVCKKNNIPFSVWSLDSDIDLYNKSFFLKHIQNNILKNCSYSFVDKHCAINKLYQKNNIISYELATNSLICKDTMLNKRVKKHKILKFIFVSKLEEINNPDILLDLFINLNNSNWQLQIIGDGLLMSNLKQKVAVNNLDSKIRFYGTQDQAFIKNILLNSDYLINTSEDKNIPSVFWSAMQCGIPILTTPVDSIVYYINKYNIGRYSKDYSFSELFKLFTFIMEFWPLTDFLKQNTVKLAKLNNIERSSSIFMEKLHSKLVISNK